MKLWLLAVLGWATLEASVVAECGGGIVTRRGCPIGKVWLTRLRSAVHPGEGSPGGGRGDQVSLGLRIGQPLRLRGGRQKLRERVDEENERVAAVLLKRLGAKADSEVDGSNKEDIEEDDVDLMESKRKSRVYVRSVHWNLVHRTALALSLPEEACDQIQPFRVDHDRDMYRWPMPSIILSQPCFSPGWLWEAADALQERLRNFSPFRVKLDSFKLVQHGSSTSIWLVPDQPSLERLEKLYNEVLSLFPTLVKKAQRLVGGEAPHITMGQVTNPKTAQEMVDELSTTWKPVEFQVTHIGFMCQPVENCAFDSRREVTIGHREEDTLERGVLSDAEANLESGSECQAVVQEWDEKRGRFVPTVDGQLGELSRKVEEREREKKKARDDKLDAEARDFFGKPAKEDEECQKLVPEDVKSQISKLLGEIGTCKLFEFIKAYRKRHSEDLTALAKDVGFVSTSAMFRLALVKEIFLTRTGQDVFVHLKVPDDAKERNSKRARLRKQLTAMKGRDRAERDKLGASYRRIKEAEQKIIGKFRKLVTPQDAMAMDNLALSRAAEERERVREAGFEDEDVETRRIYDEFAKITKKKGTDDKGKKSGKSAKKTTPSSEIRHAPSEEGNDDLIMSD